MIPSLGSRYGGFKAEIYDDIPHELRGTENCHNEKYLREIKDPFFKRILINTLKRAP